MPLQLARHGPAPHPPEPALSPARPGRHILGHRPPDGTAVWFMQHVHPEYRFVRFIEGWEESFASIVAHGGDAMPLGTHYLHDALHERQGKYKPYQPLADLQELRPRWNFDVVPPVEELIHGITAVRNLFSQMWFDESQCRTASTTSPSTASGSSGPPRPMPTSR